MKLAAILAIGFVLGAASVLWWLRRPAKRQQPIWRAVSRKGITLAADDEAWNTSSADAYTRDLAAILERERW